MKYGIILFLASMLNTCPSMAAGVPTEIEEFDLRSYAPEANGLKDLVFEVRSPELVQELSKNEALGKLIDVYYKVYWDRNAKFRITIEGLPKGFPQLNEELERSIRPIVSLVIPEKLAQQFKGYKFKKSSGEKGETQILATDTTGSKGVTEATIVFDSNNKLKSSKVNSITGLMTTNFEFGTKTWAKNKWVLEKLTTTNGVAGAATTTTVEIQSGSVESVGLPQTITQKVKMSAGGKESKEITTKYEFSKYELNTGKPIKVMSSK